ncbi:MAG TPA: hypothetical protein DEB06_02085 [Phycisphaerales bacterium]|nr:hypothetical protein [Phycisphaerales bacterium]
MTAPTPAQPDAISHRTVDLGREEEFITWQDWFGRAMAHMREVLPPEAHASLAFRVTLADGRQFAVRQVLTHVVRGRCTLQPSRWNEHEAVCDVITGYQFLGVGEDERLTSLVVPPVAIESVECVLVAGEGEPSDEPDETRTPFGFYKREALEKPVEQREVEEQLAAERHGSP